MSGFWLNQDVVTCNPTWFKEKVKRCSADNFIQRRYTVVDNEVSFANYRMYKTTFCFENYFSLLPFNYSVTLAQFRTTNTNFPVNRRRFEGIARNERICHKCDTGEVGGEYRLSV